MAQQSSFGTLRNLAEKEMDSAAQKLGEMRRSCEQVREQLEMLLSYQEEYRNNLNTTMAQGMANNRWENYQQFIGTLDKAILQHREQLDQWNRKVDKALDYWRDKKQRLQAWETLQARQQDEVRQQENRRDQKQMDEFAQRASQRKDQ